MIEAAHGANRVTGFYRGIVKAHSTNGKCKIFWPGVTPDDFENKTEFLPDAEQAAPLFAGAANKNGVFFYPDINSVVWGFFENEDVNRPVYFASTLSYKENTDTYENLNHKIRRIQIDDLVINFNTEENSVEILNGQGSISIDKEGKVLLDSQKEIEISAPKVTVNVGKDLNVSANNIKITANENIETFSQRNNIRTRNGGTTIKGDLPLYGVYVW